MVPVKRVEIVVDYLEAPRVQELLEGAGFDSWSMIREVSGRGGRGVRAGDGLSGEFTNSWILVACPEEDVMRLVELIRPVLKRFGGLCLVSDALSVKH